MDSFPYPPSCPFNTFRAGKARNLLEAGGRLTGPDKLEVAPIPLDRKVLEKFHTAEYLDALEAANRGEFSIDMLGMGLGTGDCPVFRGVYDYSVLGAGATVGAAELIAQGKASVAFNPSGGYHHAHADYAAGFCYINDNALGLMTLANAGLRALYLDVDVHHGDGVQEAFYHRRDVMTISLHQDGRTLFPGTGFCDETGTGEGTGYAVNIPLPPGTTDELYLRVINQLVLPLIGAFNPDVFVMEIGADALAKDPLAGLSLTNNVYADIIGMLGRFGKPILATGGGGYNIDNTVRAWALAWCALCGEQADDLRDPPLGTPPKHVEMVEAIVDDVIKQIKEGVFPIHNL